MKVYLSFPLQSDEWETLLYGKPIEAGIEEDDFMANFNLIFTKELKKTIMNALPSRTERYGNLNPSYMIPYERDGDNASWLLFQNIDNSWKLVGTDKGNFKGY